MHSSTVLDVSQRLLQQMKMGGFDFLQFHPIEFYAVFSNKRTALLAAKLFCGEACSTQVSLDDQGRWCLLVIKVMAATYTGITDFEQQLQRSIAGLGGVTDGWGVEQKIES